MWFWLPAGAAGKDPEPVLIESDGVRVGIVSRELRSVEDELIPPEAPVIRGKNRDRCMFLDVAARHHQHAIRNFVQTGPSSERLLMGPQV